MFQKLINYKLQIGFLTLSLPGTELEASICFPKKTFN